MSGTTSSEPELNRDALLARYAVADRSAARVRVNFISSIDGAATHEGLSGGLNNPADKIVFDTLRMISDVVVVGAGTVRAEGYSDINLAPDAIAWRTGNGLPPQPPVAIVSSNLDISPEHPLFAHPTVRSFVVTHAGAPVERRETLAEVAEVLVCGDTAVDLGLLVAALAASGLPQILCEGGPRLLGSLIDADLVDELCLTISPVLEGGPAGRIAHGTAASTRRMALTSLFSVEDMLFLRYERKRASGDVELPS
jgi:riboflavin biosynthesis pyrimidine reductase